ncbi:MAG: hypothetical protein ABW019_14685 [Chitinophagaceae bacterium]
MQRAAGLLFLLLSAIFVACEKRQTEPNPTPLKPGAIKGILSPADAAVRLVCTPASGGAAVELENPGGSFKIDNVPAGQYTVSVIPKLGYTAPAGVGVTITGGDTANAGTLILVPNSPTAGFLKFNLDGNAYNLAVPDVTCSYTGTALTITATTPPTPPYWTFAFGLANVTGTGTHTLGLTSRDSIQGNQYLPVYTYALVYSTKTLDGSGSIILAELDPVTRVVSGTFSATMPQKGLGPTKHMTNGSFRLNY